MPADYLCFIISKVSTTDLIPSFSIRQCINIKLISKFPEHLPPDNRTSRGGHCIGDCTPTRDRGQSEVKRSRRNFEAGQAVKLGIGGSLSTVKVSPGDRWAWLMLDSQGSRPDFRCGQEVKHGNLLPGQDLDPGRGWKYRRSCSVTPLNISNSR